MSFNSLDFAFFLPIVFFIYWFLVVGNLRFQNFFVLSASYVFYGWWDWRFLALVMLSTLIDYSIGLGLKRQEEAFKRKILLLISIIVNLGILGVFKYYDFFIDNFVSAFSFIGFEIKANTLNLILPVGISFYTFQTLSYTIDVYREKLEPTQDLIAFSAYVAFFPQLVAGPIERAKNLLPQFKRKRTFNYIQAKDGLRQILWGLVKKIVIADNCAFFANEVFNNSSELSGSTLAVGLLFYAFQAYGDFSGYSDIAIGTARLFGFNLMKNFAHPYFSRSVAELWRKWHISLTTWLKDYVYIPLGGRNKKIRNIPIVFILVGLWHGANWTFIVFGVLQSIYLLLLSPKKAPKGDRSIVAKGKVYPSFKELMSMSATFILFTISLVFIRAENISHATGYLETIFSPSFFTLSYFPNVDRAITMVVLIIIFMSLEWLGREDEYAIEKLGLAWKRSLRWGMYFSLIISIFYFMPEEAEEFIYFQF